MVDITKLSDADLHALSVGDVTRLSDEGLRLLSGAAPTKESSILGEIGRGAEQLVSSTIAGVKGVVSPEEAALENLRRQQGISERYGEGPSLAKLTSVYEKEGLWPAAKELAGQIPEAVAQQVFQLAALAGGARIGAMTGAAVAPALGPFAPVAPIVGGAIGAGGAMLPQFFGQDITRQAEAQIAAKQPVDVSRGAAAIGATGQAALEAAGTAFVVGKRVIKSIMGIADDAAIASARATAKTTADAERALLGTVMRGMARGTGEVPVEIGQAVIERAQAGLPLLSDEAFTEYGENAYLAGIVGPTIGGAANVQARSQARTELERIKVAEAQRKSEAERLAYETLTPEQLAEFDAISAVRQRDAAMRELEGVVPVAPLQQIETRPRPDTAEALGMKYAQPGETLDMLAGMQATPTPVVAPEAEPEPAPFSTVLTPEVLASTGLKPQSGFYRQLVGKDMADAGQQKQIADTLIAVRQNKTLSPSTKTAIERIAMQAFGALAQQQVMFGPRGGVRPEAVPPKPVRPKKVEEEIPSPPPFQEPPIDLRGRDERDTAPVEQRGVVSGVGVSGEPVGTGLGAVSAEQPAAPVGTGVVPAGPDVAVPVAATRDVAATLTPTPKEKKRAAKAAEAPVSAVQEEAQPEPAVPASRKVAPTDQELDAWMGRFEADMLAPETETTDTGETVSKQSEGAVVRESIRRVMETKDNEDYAEAMAAIAGAEYIPPATKKKTAKTEPVANRVRQVAIDFLAEQSKTDPEGVKQARARAARREEEVRGKARSQEETKKQQARDIERAAKAAEALQEEAEVEAERAAEQAESAFWKEERPPRKVELTKEGKKDVKTALRSLRAAAKKAGVKFSRTRPVNDAERSTTKRVIDALAGWYIDARSERLQVVDTFDDLPADIRALVEAEGVNPRDVQGFVADGVAYMVAGNIKAGTEASVFMHEVGAHLGLTAEEVSAAAARIRIWGAKPVGSRERAVHDAAKARMEAAGETSDAELVAYVTEEAVKAGIKPRALKTPKTLADVRTLQDLVDVLAKMFSTAVRQLLGAADIRLTAQDVVDLTYGAARAALRGDVKGGEGLQFSKFSAATTPQSWNDIVGSSEIMQKQPGVVRRMFKTLTDTAAEVGIVDSVRTYVADAAAPVAAKIDAAFDGKVRDSLGNINPMGQYRQAQDYNKLMISFFELGAIKKDKSSGHYNVATVEGVPSMKDVATAVQDWGKANGMTFDEAYASASKMLEAVRQKALMDADPTYQPNKLANKDPQDAKAQIAEGVKLYNATPEVQKISALLDKNRFRLIDQMAEVGRITKDEAQFWKDASGYVPFDRIEDFSTKFRSLRRVGVGVSQLGALPRFIGSTTREVGNILDNYTKLNGWMVGQILKQDANTAMLREMHRLGFAKAPVKAESVAGKSIPKEKAVKIYVDGVEHAVELHSKYDQSAFSELPEVKGVLMRAFGSFANFLRTAITAMPPFAIKQVTDDVQRAFFTSGVENPSALIIPSLRNFITISIAELRGQRHPYLREFGQKGLTGEFDLNNANPAETILQDLGFRQRGPVKKLLHKLEGITRASDLAVRKAIYDQTMKETHDAALARTRAREFINFRRHGAGAIMPALISTIPFFNAYIQGMDVLLRSATGKDSSMAAGRAYARAMFVKRAVQLTALSTIYALMMADDDEYKDMDIHARNNNWVLPGGVKLSLPGELGALFKVPTEMALEYWRRQGTPEQMQASEAAITALQAVVSAYVGRAMPIPTAVKPVIEAVTNFSFFTGRPLIGAYHKELDPSQQKATRTSELAIAISNFSRDAVGVDAVSPILVDNFLQGYFGSVASLTQLMTDKLLNPDRLDRPVHKYWLLSNYLYDPIGKRRVTEFYDVRDRVVVAQNTLRELMKTDPERAEKYALDHEPELTMAASVNATLESLEMVRAYQKYLASSLAAKELTQDERTKAKQEADKLETGYVGWVREAKAQLGLR